MLAYLEGSYHRQEAFLLEEASEVARPYQDSFVVALHRLAYHRQEAYRQEEASEVACLLGVRLLVDHHFDSKPTH